MDNLPIIMLVEDEPEIVTIIKRLFNRTLGQTEKSPQFQYLEYSKGQEAIVAIRGDTQKLIVAVISDNTLLDGFKGLEVIDAAVQAGIPYVASLSSYNADGLIETCKNPEIASRSVAENNGATIAIGREVTCNLKPPTADQIAAIVQAIKPHLEAYYFNGLEHS